MSFGSSEITPTTPLQAARIDRGWKQAQVIRAVQQQAARDGTPIASAASLKTMLSRWENGQPAEAMYQRLLCKVYGLSPDELGFISRQDAQRTGTRRVVPAISTDTVNYFRNVFAEHIRADNLLGPHHLVEVVKAQATLLDHLLPSARNTVKAELTHLACQYNEFTGWLYQDSGDSDKAMSFSDRAMDFALEADDAYKAAYVLMRKANIAIDQGRPERAIGLTEAALRHGEKLPARIRALILSQRARAHATLRQSSDCMRSIEASDREIHRARIDDDDLASYCNPSYIEMEAATCWNLMDMYDAAIPVYERSLAGWPSDGLRRDQGLCLARLTTAYVGRGDIERACATGRRAVSVVKIAMSSRSVDELLRLRTRLTPWRRDEGVSDLNGQIRELIAG
ncbi:helix-turn-helix domain-containing protein [Rugosimonospora africana]|uniref:XRE family transcriptional regulator n=1 Tax=Rugosimonospora africana TaxID=556532 RepID=A0A8J3VQ69_9ACTN|nr:helix-turn-helix transcriptional regulator [Rugosimonospora africana]GIH14712.1 hypothetical protein Raf01_28840 [Rugosimonospora africana]